MKNPVKVKTGYFPVKGVDLYYELRGDGPYLILIPPGAGDARSYEAMAGFLANWYTVITYDRRGYSRSKLKNPDEIPTITSQADDVYALLISLTKAPAYVYGNSAGGVIGFDLLTRYPYCIFKIMFSEPAQFLSRDPQIKNDVNLGQLFREGGLEALGKAIGVDFKNRKPDPELAGLSRQANLEFFLKKEASVIGEYTPQLDALEASAKKVTVLVGGSTTAQHGIAYRGAVIAAAFFHKEIVYFPGDHNGYEYYPEEYAGILHDAFEKA